MDNINYKERYKKYKLKYLSLKKYNSNKIKGGYIEHATSFITDNTKMLFNSIGLIPLLLISGVGIIGIIICIFLVNTLINYDSKEYVEQEIVHVNRTVNPYNIESIKHSLESVKTEFNEYKKKIDEIQEKVYAYKLNKMCEKCIDYIEILQDNGIVIPPKIENELKCISRLIDMKYPLRVGVINRLFTSHDEDLIKLQNKIKFLMEIINTSSVIKSVYLNRCILILNIYMQRLDKIHHTLSISVSKETIEVLEKYKPEENIPITNIIGIPISQYHISQDVDKFIKFTENTTFGISGDGIRKHRWIDMSLDTGKYSVGLTFSTPDILYLLESIYYLIYMSEFNKPIEKYIKVTKIHLLYNHFHAVDTNTFLYKQLQLSTTMDNFKMDNVYEKVINQNSIKHEKYYIKNIVGKLNVLVETPNLPFYGINNNDSDISVEYNKEYEEAFRKINDYITYAKLRFDRQCRVWRLPPELYAANPPDANGINDVQYPKYLEYEYVLLMSVDAVVRNTIILNMSDIKKQIMIWLIFLKYTMLGELYKTTNIKILDKIIDDMSIKKENIITEEAYKKLIDIRKTINDITQNIEKERDIFIIEEDIDIFINEDNNKNLYNISDSDLDNMFNIASIKIEDTEKMKYESRVRGCIEDAHTNNNSHAHCTNNTNIKEISDKGIYFNQTTPPEKLNNIYQKGIIYWIINNMYTMTGNSFTLYLQYKIQPLAHLITCNKDELNCIEFTNLFKNHPKELLKDIIKNTLKIYGLPDNFITNIQNNVITKIEENKESLNNIHAACMWRLYYNNIINH